ncbi:MAG: GGDEF domain-containing protein [Leptonema sp. (in: bacteria)]
MPKGIVDVLTFAFQPIIDLRSRRIFGFEALLRNYQEAGYTSIFDFFDSAFLEKNLYKVDILLREKLLNLFIQIPEYQKRRIFYNIDNRILEMPDFESGNTLKILKKYNLPNSCLIFEISERMPFKSYESLSQIILNYKKQGYKIAIDDFGVGYSSLQLIYISEPDILKLDKFFIYNIHSDQKKKLFVEQIVKTVHLLGGQIVAEGIETYEELLTCLELGIDLAQGYYICEPFYIDEYNHHLKKIRELFDSLELIDLYSIKKKETILDYLKIEFVPPLEITMKIQDVLEHIRKYHNFISFPVVNEYKEPVGLLKEKKIKMHFLNQYSLELWKYKSFSEFLETNLHKTFILESATEINSLIEILSKNEDIGIKNLSEVIITEKGKYKGMISPEEILRYLFQKKLITARDQNPLSNLPGNQSISKYLREISGYLGMISLVYLDIKDFKPFNDTFGFEAGDKLILWIAQYLRKFTFYKDNYFVGHIGGDDFILIIRNKNLFHIIKIVLDLQKEFAKNLKDLKLSDSCKDSHYIAKNRYGIEQKFEIPAITAGILFFKNGEIPLEKLSILLADVKSKSKNSKKFLSYKVL